MSLDSRLIDRIFLRLTGLYGSQFTSKFRHVENGVDVGITGAKEAWGYELRNFGDNLDAIAYALEHLPAGNAPNAIEFRDACKRCPRKNENHVRLENKPTQEDKDHQREMAHKVSAAVRPREFDDLLWAKKPKSQTAMDVIADAKKHASRFPALANVFDQLVTDGICNEVGKLLKRWDGCQWVKA